MPLLGSSRKRVSVRFFVVAMVFIVFDVEVAFSSRGRFRYEVCLPRATVRCCSTA